MPSVAAVTGRIQGGKITQRSTLIVEGDVTIENLDLDGCLVKPKIEHPISLANFGDRWLDVASSWLTGETEG